MNLNKTQRWFLVILVFTLFVLVPFSSIAAYWGGMVGLLPHTAIVIPTDAATIDRTMGSMLKGIYGNRIQIVSGTATDEIAAAITAAGTNGTIKFYPGTYSMAASGSGSTIIPSDNQTLIGWGAKFNLGSSVQENLIGMEAKTGITIIGMSLNGNKDGNVEAAESGDSIQNGIWVKDSTYINLVSNFIEQNIFHGIMLHTSSNVTVRDNVIQRNRFRGILSQQQSNYNTIDNNRLARNGDRANYNGGTYGGSTNGGIGVLASSYVTVSNNKIVEDQANSGVGGIDLTFTLASGPVTTNYGNKVINNTIDVVLNGDTPGIRVSGAAGGRGDDLLISGNTVIANQTWGLMFDTAVIWKMVVTSNVFRDAKVGDSGVALEEAIIFRGNIVFYNVTSAYMFKFTAFLGGQISSNFFYGYGNSEGVQLINGDDNEILDNVFYNMQTYSVNTDAASTGNRISGSKNTASSPTMVIGSTNNVVYRNDGYVTENSGTFTITTGSTSTNITHGLGFTPAIGDIVLTPSATMGSASYLYADTIGATIFIINANTDPVSANITGGWAVKK